MQPFIHHVHLKTQLSDSGVTGNFVCWGEILTHVHLSIKKKVQTRFVQTTESDKECTSLAQALCKKSEK